MLGFLGQMHKHVAIPFQEFGWFCQWLGTFQTSWVILSMFENLPDKLGTSAVGTSELVRATRWAAANLNDAGDGCGDVKSYWDYGVNDDEADDDVGVKDGKLCRWVPFLLIQNRNQYEAVYPLPHQSHPHSQDVCHRSKTLGHKHPLGHTWTERGRKSWAYFVIILVISYHINHPYNMHSAYHNHSFFHDHLSTLEHHIQKR